jgi:hypothetical protein
MFFHISPCGRLFVKYDQDKPASLDLSMPTPSTRR